jgi:hypothetical protein
MANLCLLELPNEFLYHVFDYCDVETIVLSLRHVCKRLYCIIHAYNRFNLKYNSYSDSKIKVISRLIQPESVVSLTISSMYRGDNMTSFTELFDIRRFTRLYSLTLDNVRGVELQRFLEKISPVSLDVLSIRSSEWDTWDLVSSVAARFNLRKLFLDSSHLMINTISFPKNWKLESLAITDFSLCFEQLEKLLSLTPGLYI